MIITSSGVPPDAVLLGDVDTLGENLESLGDDIRAAITVVLTKLLLQVLGSFLGMVVRHLAEEMMGDVGVLDVMESTVSGQGDKTVSYGTKRSISVAQAESKA